MATYKVLRGVHVERGEGRTLKKYRKGQVFTSQSDLLRFNGRSQKTQKYRKISDEDNYSNLTESTPSQSRPPQPPARPTNDALDDMTVAQLKKFAEDEEIDLSGVTSKAEIIDRIRSAA